jgi:hypothetical protein
MAKKTLTIKNWSGSIGTAGEKQDVANSFRYLRNLNPFEDTSYITLSKAPSKVSGSTPGHTSTVDGLVYWIQDGSPWSTSRYFYDDGGQIYQETSGGTWTTLRTVSGGAGEGFKVFDDYLYYALGAELGRYGKLSGTPTFSDSFLSDGTTDLDQSSTGTGQADYVPPTSIAETAAARNTVTPTHDPMKDIVINVDVVGSGDWTVTIHDSGNVSIGSKTIANASMATGDVKFTFATPLRVIIGNAYHYHVTSTVADGGVDTGVATDLEGSYFLEHYGILIDSDWHPMVEFLNFLVIGNDRYLAKWDQATYEPNYITFAPGFICRTIAKFNEFIVAGCYRGGSVRESEEARLYFWDGIESTFNYFVDCKVGAANALLNHENSLIGVYGNDGSMYVGTEPFTDIVDKMTTLARGKYLEVYPGAVTTFGGSALIGVAGATDDATLNQGVYEYGHQQTQLPLSFNYPYLISTGTYVGTSTKIGCVQGIGTDLYYSWRDDTSYGVDKIALGANSAASGTLETLIFDSGDPERQLLPHNIKMTFEGLAAGQSVTPKYKLDRAASWTDGTAITTADTTELTEPIYTRCQEIEFGFTLASSGGTFPKVTALNLDYDTLEKEG